MEKGGSQTLDHENVKFPFQQVSQRTRKLMKLDKALNTRDDMANCLCLEKKEEEDAPTEWLQRCINWSSQEIH